MHKALLKLITKKIQSGEIGIRQILLVEPEGRQLRLEGIQIESRRREK